MKIAKIRDVQTPVRGTAFSAGIDFFVPNDFDPIDLLPGEDVKIPSGIKTKINQGYALIAFNKSGVATKQRLQVGACVVDEDYQGEIHLHVFNSSNSIIRIVPGQKLVQFILVPVSYADPVLVSEEYLFPEETDRGQGGFGSTGLT